jgi:hypothetical protein
MEVPLAQPGGIAGGPPRGQVGVVGGGEPGDGQPLAHDRQRVQGDLGRFTGDLVRQRTADHDPGAGGGGADRGLPLGAADVVKDDVDPVGARRP